MKYHLIALTLSALLCGCANDSHEIPQPDKLTYPFHASESRANQIRGAHPKLVIGMPLENVRELLGEPDEINMFYASHEHMESSSPDGQSWVYLIQRVKPYGGLLDRQEISLKLRFDNNQRLSNIESNGMGRQTSSQSPSRRKPEGQRSKPRFPGAAY